MGMGGLKLKPNSFSSLKLKTAHSVSLASFSFFFFSLFFIEAGQHELPNESYSLLVPNFEVLKPYSENRKKEGG